VRHGASAQSMLAEGTPRNGSDYGLTPWVRAFLLHTYNNNKMSSSYVHCQRVTCLFGHTLTAYTCRMHVQYLLVESVPSIDSSSHQIAPRPFHQPKACLVFQPGDMHPSKYFHAAVHVTRMAAHCEAERPSIWLQVDYQVYLLCWSWSSAVFSTLIYM
jgi:hypothetical protein